MDRQTDEQGDDILALQTVVHMDLKLSNFSVRNYIGGLHTKLVDFVVSEYVRRELNTLRSKNSFLVAGTGKLIGCALKEYDLGHITFAK